MSSSPATPPPVTPTGKKPTKATPKQKPATTKPKTEAKPRGKQNKLEIATLEASQILDWRPKTEQLPKDPLGKTKVSFFISGKGADAGTNGVQKDRDAIYQNLAALAGYLGLPTTQHLREFVTSAAVADIYAAWAYVRERNWGMDATNRLRIADVKLSNIWLYVGRRKTSEKALFQLLINMPEAPSWTTTQLTATLEVHAVPSSPNLLPSFITLHAMIHLVMANPGVFKDSHLLPGTTATVDTEAMAIDDAAPVDAPVDWDLDEEDLLRANTLLNGISNHIAKDKNGADKADVAHAFSSGQINVAIPPFYYDAKFARNLRALKEAAAAAKSGTSTDLAALIGGPYELALRQTKIALIKARHDPERNPDEDLPSEREARQARSIQKKIYGPSMTKISKLNRLRPGQDQLDTLAAIYSKAEFVENPAAHLTTNEDLLEVADIDRQHAEVAQLAAAVKLKAGAGIDSLRTREDQPLEPTGPRNSDDELANNNYQHELATYQRRLQSLDEAREARRVEIESFKAGMETTRLISVPTATYREACARLNLDPLHPTIGSKEHRIPMKPWQVTGLDYLLNLVPPTLRAHILADDCGLGKTLLTLELEHRQKLRQLEKHANGEAADLRPSIIWCPANIMGVWLKEYERLYADKFKIRVYAWSAATLSSSDPRFKFMIDHRELAHNLLTPGGSLHRDNPEAVLTTIICPYQTWASRTLIRKTTYDETLARFTAEIADNQDVSRSAPAVFGAPQRAAEKTSSPLGIFFAFGAPQRPAELSIVCADVS